MLRSSGQYASTFKYDQDLMYYYSSESSKAESCGVNFLNTQAQVTSNTTGFDTNTGNPLDNIRPSRLGGWTGENRGFAPNINQRNTIGNNILAWSSTNLDRTSYSHSDWIFLGLGGYFIKPDQSLAGYNYKWSEVSGSASTVATNLNTWIYNKITDGTAMSTTLGYYPVGIVMMNRVEDYQQTAIKEIILLNNKFHKAFDPSKPAWP